MQRFLFVLTLYLAYSGIDRGKSGMKIFHSPLFAQKDARKNNIFHSLKQRLYPLAVVYSKTRQDSYLK